MFQKLGNFVARYRHLVIAGWIVLAVGFTLAAPHLEEVSSTDQKDFLPESAPFARAAEVQEAYFPAQTDASSSVIIVDAGPGGTVYEPEVWAYLSRLEAWLNSAHAPGNITVASGPTGAPELANALISESERTALVGFGLDTVTDARPTTEAVTAVDAWLDANTPDALTVYQSGEAALNAQAEESTFTTMDRTIWITVVLVIVALLVIYRSPVSPLIPLFAVTAALFVTLGIIAILAERGVIAAITQVQAILIAVMYGAGTDYCLFLISRFREEMAGAASVLHATRRTVRLVGETITSSAGTVFVGFMSLSFAEMGMFKSAGPMLAIGIGVSLLAGLTLVPALLATLGQYAFWPARAQHRSSGRLYGATSKLVSSKPLLTIVIITAMMAPFSIYGYTQDLNYDMVSELPEEIDSVQGYELLQAEMGGGVLFPATVVITERTPDEVAAEIVVLTGELQALPGVTDVRGLHTPLGSSSKQLNNLLRVEGQLDLLLALAADDDEGDATDPEAMLAGMRAYVALLAAEFPDIATNANFVTAQEILDGGPFGLMMRQDELLTAVAGLRQRFAATEDAYLLPPAGESGLFAALDPVFAEYLTADGRSYRLEVVLTDPIGTGGFDTINDIREMLRAYEGDGDAVVSGLTAVFTDTRDVMDRDMVRAFGFILAGIFIVLMLMLRSVVAPLYLIATVLLSYTCTLGLTSLFFEKIMGVDKLSWMLPMFMFVFLVALGIDYSIFLFGRIKEEVGHHGIREGVHTAVAATGSIITSAGIILAGTFAGMMAGEIAFLAQLGFAVAIGVLIDTFIVRTVLDPALATLFGRWTWWPGGVPQATVEKKRPLRPEGVAGD